MSLILQRLTATPAAVRRQRAQIIDSQLRNKQLELISNLRSKCDAIELQINQLTDIAHRPPHHSRWKQLTHRTL